MSDAFADRKWIDVTRPLRNNIVHWPGDSGFTWRRVASITGPGTCNLSEIRMSVHTGTHMDAPLHFIADGADIDQVALDRLCGRAVVVHVPHARDAEPGDLAAAAIEPGDRVLLKTVNEKLWRKPEFDPTFVGISAAAAEWLVQHGASAVGVDYLSVDRYDDPHKAAHYTLLGAGIPIIEGLDLSAIRAGGYEMVALPLRLPGSDGSPARVILRER